MADRRPLMDRFWEKVDKLGPVSREGLEPCWVWTGSLLKRRGYGRIQSGKSQNDVIYAHRVSFEFEFGPIPAHHHVLHVCDNRACVRPTHLFIGTAQDNLTDCAKKDRIPFGERHVHHKLTEENVRCIRAEYDAEHQHRSN